MIAEKSLAMRRTELGRGQDGKTAKTGRAIKMHMISCIAVGVPQKYAYQIIQRLAQQISVPPGTTEKHGVPRRH